MSAMSGPAKGYTEVSCTRCRKLLNVSEKDPSYHMSKHRQSATCMSVAAAPAAASAAASAAAAPQQQQQKLLWRNTTLPC